MYEENHGFPLASTDPSPKLWHLHASPKLKPTAWQFCTGFWVCSIFNLLIEKYGQRFLGHLKQWHSLPKEAERRNTVYFLSKTKVKTCVDKVMWTPLKPVESGWQTAEHLCFWSRVRLHPVKWVQGPASKSKAVIAHLVSWCNVGWC